MVQKIGQLICWWFTESGSPRLCVGPSWMLFVCMSTVIFCLTCSFFFSISVRESWINQIFGFLLFAFTNCSYWMTALKNPGIASTKFVVLDSDDISSGGRLCEMCRIHMEPSTRHCRLCDVCIEGHDHHCHWISKCVGKGNINHFQGFMAGLFGSFIYVGVTLGMRLYSIK